MSETQVQAGIVTKLEDEGSECGSRRQAMVLQVTDSIPMGPVSPARAGLSGRSARPSRRVSSSLGSQLWNRIIGHCTIQDYCA